MVATFLQLYHSLAAMAALPTQLFRLLQKRVRFFVLRAVSRAMPFPIARITDLGTTTATLGILAPMDIPVDVLGLDPLTAPSGRAVDAVAGGVLGILSVPLLLEVGVKQPLDMLQRNVVGRAALGRHVLRIPHRQPKAVLQAGVAHSVSAFQPRRLVRRHIVFHTNDALNP
jgi:hypothetical protein